MKTYLEIPEIERMEEASQCMRDRLLNRILARTGCRITEVISLTTDDVDLESGLVKIIHLKRRVKLLCPSCGARLAKRDRYCNSCGRAVEVAGRQEKEQAKFRMLSVDTDTLAMIRQYVERGGPVLKKDGKHYLFGINRHRAWQIVKECAERAGLPELVNSETGKKHHVSPHRLRDAFAVHAVKADDSGDGLRLLQVHLGHASFDTTARYRKVAGEEHRRWYDKLWEKGAGHG
jgi:integrase/recombinase XerD